MTDNNLKIKTFPLLPLRDIVLFPYMVVPLFVGRDKSLDAVVHASEGEREIVVVTQKEAKNDDPQPDDMYNIGVYTRILQLLRLSDGTVKILVEGIGRVMLKEYRKEENFYEASIIHLEREIEKNSAINAMMGSLLKLFDKFINLSHKVPPEGLVNISNIEEPARFVDTVAAILPLKTSDKQRLLEILDPAMRLEELHSVLESEIDVLQVEKKVKGRVKQQVEKNQKEYYLQEQMKAIQKELGRHDEQKSEIEELSEKITKAKMPKEIDERAMKELRRLEQMPPMSAEGTVVRNYIDWLVDMPWAVRTKERLDIEKAKKILDTDHYGLEKVKERILEYLSVLTLTKSIKGPILCLVGPPGVGKTSLGKSIARATGRKFVRVSLGGIRDEAEIRGHRRTYIGAMPGRIIQSMKKGGAKNPVFMLDEVDKMNMDLRGDPASALLEVLDPEQNNAFNDHFLEVDFDLSEVMFIATANVLHSIPKPLIDRMEVLRMEGYTEYEKIEIAERYLIPRNLKNHGLGKDKIKFKPTVLHNIIEGYTRESGVRNLERAIASVCRKVTRKVVEIKQKKKIEPQKFIPGNLVKYLGVPQFKRIDLAKKKEVGLANGLAWTEVGGETLSIEVTVMDGRGKLTLTGKLGDVMKESAQAALGYVRSRSMVMGLPKNFYYKTDIHIHVPEGAIPKDGPSAGITMATALVSALAKRPVKREVGMTGEITLLGRILRIGGLKEKLLAAQRAGITTIVIPKDNEDDLSEIPVNITKAFEIFPVETLDEVLNIALEESPISMPEFAEKGSYPVSLPSVIAPIN